jgi:hypothetical protein
VSEAGACTARPELVEGRNPERSEGAAVQRGTSRVSPYLLNGGSRFI